MLFEVPGYQLTGKLSENMAFRVYRGERIRDSQPVIIKVLNQPSPSPKALADFWREFEILKVLDLPGVEKAYALENYQKWWILVLEDFGGRPVGDQDVAGRMQPQEYLHLALQLAQTLGDVHARHIIHRNISPSTVALNRYSHQVKITDFARASLVSQEKVHVQPPSELTEYLAYISPEMTGRMNRPVDYRTDYYSLGATLYELLTATPPFRGQSPLELFHAHLAVLPDPPAQRIEPWSASPAAFDMLSGILLKLLAKNPDDRYQTPDALRADLRQCLYAVRQGSEQGTEAPAFTPGQTDRRTDLNIPRTVIGREQESQRLLQAFLRTIGGPAEMVLVGGAPGIGKTTLVNQLVRPVVEHKGWFLQGKFDAVHPQEVYPALSSVLEQFCLLVLSEPGPSFTEWRRRIQAAVTPHGQVLVNLCPQLENVIGPQPLLEAVDDGLARRRFLNVVIRFLQAVCRPDRPVVIFLDDLQWSAPDTLPLWRSVLTAPSIHNLLVVGAYRDNDAYVIEEIQRLAKEVREAHGRVDLLQLQNLDRSTIDRLVAAALASDTAVVSELTRLVYETTSGNPYFSHEYLKSLYRDQLLTFDSVGKNWHWDTARIEKYSAGSNVLELLALEIAKLDQGTQAVLHYAACIGRRFDAGALLAVVGRDRSRSLSYSLWRAMTEGLIYPLDENYRFLAGEIMDSFDAETSELLPRLADLLQEEIYFEFQHDNVQQAVLGMLDDRQLKTAHLEIGWRLLAKTERSGQEITNRDLFAIVDHLNLGSALIEDQAETIQLAELNLRASNQARSVAAFQVASNYLSAGMQLLPPGSWEDHYELTYDLYAASAEVAVLNSDLATAERLALAAEAKALSFQDKARIVRTRVEILTFMVRFREAVKVATGLIEQAGFDLKVGETPADRVEQIMQLPDMVETRALAVSWLIEPLITGTYATRHALFIPIINFFVDLFSRYGNPPNAGYVYIAHAMILLGHFEKVEGACRIGRLALEMSERQGNLRALCAARQVYYSFIFHWAEPAKDSLRPLHDNIQPAFDAGSIRFAINSCDFECQHSLFVGLKLEDVQAKQVAALQQFELLRPRPYTQRLRIWAQVVANLRGEHPDSQELAGEFFDGAEARELEEAGENSLFLMNMYVARSYLSLLFHEPRRALEASASAVAVMPRGQTNLIVARHLFIYSLALLSGGLDNSDLAARLEKVDENLRLMRLWAARVPENYLHQLELVQAEQARCLGLEKEAAASYERAFQNAMKYGYIQDAALSAELAAEFYLARKDYTVAEHNLATAYDAYAAWGAKAKLAELVRRYPEWLPPTEDPRRRIRLYPAAQTRPTGQIASSIDSEAILKASLELSQETNLDELLTRLMSIVMENAGAQNGSLIQWRDGGWFLEVQVSSESGHDPAFVALPLEHLASRDGASLLPSSLVHYVINTQAPLLLEDASASAWFSQDEYIRNRLPKSILCAPLMNQGVMSGVIYLENNLTAGAFTPARLETVRLISGQAAISIENARLYRNLEKLVDERTRELTETNRRLESEIHGRILVEEALRVSEQQYRAVFENTGTAMAIIEPEGYILLPNEEFVQLTGYSREELEDRFDIQRLVASEDLPRMRQYRQERLEDPARLPHTMEFRLVDRSGNEKAILNTAAYLPASQGIILSWIDISQRKAAEDAQRYNEALLRKVLEVLPAGVWILDKSSKIISTNAEGERIWAGARYVARQQYEQYKAWRADTGELIKSDEWAGTKAIAKGESTLNEELQIEAFDGARRTILNSAMPLTIGDNDELVGAIVVNQDITELKHHQDELQKAHDQLSTLLDISQSILSILDVDRLLNFILEQLERVIPYDGAAIVNVEQGYVVPQVMRPASLLQESPTSRMPTADSDLVKRLIASRQTIYVPDMQTETNILAKMQQIWKIPTARFGTFRSWLSVPLIAKDNLVGILILLHSEMDHYPPPTRALAQAFASQVAIAIDNARLYKQAGEAAALEERNRLAREMHDSVAQVLYSMSLFTDATRKALQANKLEVVKKNVEELAELSREALSDMRLLIFELRPPILQQVGLAAALQSRLEAVEARARFRTTFRSEGEIRLTSEQEGELYRIAQEALSNVIKHAHADEVMVELIRQGDCIRLTIQDDGAGFDVEAAEQQGGQGFRGISERAKRIGARRRIESAPGQGTKLTIEVNV